MSKISRWTPEEDALLLEHGDGPATRAQWCDLAAKKFPGRSGEACRMRYQIQQRKALGIESPPRLRPSTARLQPKQVRRVDRETEALAEAESARRQSHPTITGYVFGDPLPGRSALDKRNTGVSA